MRAVKCCRAEITPVIPLPAGDIRPDGFAVMDIFSLGMQKLANFTGVIKLLHFHGSLEIAVILGECVYLAAFFHSFNQFHRLGQVLAGNYLAGYIPSGVECPHGVRGVLVGVICQDDGVKIVL